MPSVLLKPGRTKSIQRRHPWIFSGAIGSVVGDPQPGATVDVCAPDGTRLAAGAYSPRSQIAVRVWSFEPDQTIDRNWFGERLDRALDARASLQLPSADTNCLRLVNAESDGLPGLVVDQYGEFLVCQFLSAGAEHWKSEIVQLLTGRHPGWGVYERSDVDVRDKEGLPSSAGLLAGEPPPDLLEVQEHGRRFLVDVVRGHKTGFYLDQRENRLRVAALAAGREILNCFAYTGAFGVYALGAEAAHVTNVESSSEALEIARRTAERNSLDLARLDSIQADVFHQLRQYRDARRQFDLIILDPPKFAESRSQLEGAARGYKDINLLAFKLLRTGGLLVTFSCSGLVSPDLFQKIVAGAALDSGRDVQILERLTQAPDHPVALNFPEGEYLKGLVCRVG